VNIEAHTKRPAPPVARSRAVAEENAWWLPVFAGTAAFQDVCSQELGSTPLFTTGMPMRTTKHTRQQLADESLARASTGTPPGGTRSRKPR
jgi:hypothetical protein